MSRTVQSAGVTIALLPDELIYQVYVKDDSDHDYLQWKLEFPDANLFVNGNDGSVVFYKVTEDGVWHFVVAYPQGWWGSFCKTSRHNVNESDDIVHDDEYLLNWHRDKAEEESDVAVDVGGYYNEREEVAKELRAATDAADAAMKKTWATSKAFVDSVTQPSPPHPFDTPRLATEEQQLIEKASPFLVNESPLYAEILQRLKEKPVNDPLLDPSTDGAVLHQDAVANVGPVRLSDIWEGKGEAIEQDDPYSGELPTTRDEHEAHLDKLRAAAEASVYQYPKHLQDNSE